MKNKLRNKIFVSSGLISGFGGQRYMSTVRTQAFSVSGVGKRAKKMSNVPIETETPFSAKG